MKPLAIAAAFALLALQPRPGLAQPAEAAPSEALVDRFIAVLPDRDAISEVGEEIDPDELSRLAALNPGKEAQVRAILQKNLACTGPEITAGSLRMLRTVARGLGEARLKKLISFYEGPDYSAFAALAARMEGKPTPSAADSAAMAKFMGTYPLQAFHSQLSRGEEIIAADQGFMTAAMKCASEQIEAFEAAGLKSE